MNKELELLLIRINAALEDYIHPHCDKCKTKVTKRSCDCEDAIKKIKD